MKQFPVQMQQQNTMIVPQTLNTNTSLYENETNGRLNGQNIAVDSINFSHFKPVDVSTVNSGKIITTKFKGATQQYQSVSRYNKDFGGNIFAYLVIPFSVPVGSQNVRIDIRWKTITTNALTVTSIDGNPTTKLEMFGAEILAKNTYR